MLGPGGGEYEGRRKDIQGDVYRCFLICKMGMKGTYLMERGRDYMGQYKSSAEDRVWNVVSTMDA